MDTKHTPGPWAFEDEQVRGRSGELICDPYVRPTAETKPGEMEANGSLLAAAPELLAALKKIVKDEERRANDLRHREAWLPLQFSEERLAAARAAIAKAEGDGLTAHRVTLHEEKGDKLKLHFDCMAEDADHAAEQALNAYPAGEVLHVQVIE